MKTIHVYFNNVRLASITRSTFEEAEHIGKQYSCVFGGGEGFRIERIADDEAQAIAEFNAA